MTATVTAEELQQFAGMPAAEFVLHRKPMLFLDRLVDIGEDYATCEWCIGKDFDLLEPGLGVPAYAGVEYMAQCVAVHAGARARARGFVPPHGFLLGTRHYRCTVPYFEADTNYQATCQELIRDSQGMGSFACRILLNGNSIAEANLAVLERPQEIKRND